MKYLKFTYVDAITGISIAAEPAMNGPKFPAVPGLEFVWARESQYPTPVPQFFGTCPDDSPTQVEGVLGVFLQTDWEHMRADEMRARVPQTISKRQAERVLHADGWLDRIEAAIAAAPMEVQIDWRGAKDVDRYWPALLAMQPALGIPDAQLDDWFIRASKL